VWESAEDCALPAFGRTSFKILSDSNIKRVTLIANVSTKEDIFIPCLNRGYPNLSNLHAVSAVVPSTVRRRGMEPNVSTPLMNYTVTK
jgi:hypothetical protein